jgi:hypothetical protein
MEPIFKPNSEFDFSKLSLGQPQPLQGGSYYTKLIMEGNDIYVQFPKCKTKQGLIQTERKMYTDLLYETDVNAQLSEWIENLETTCQKIIYEKRNLWFNAELDMNDIETAFNSIGKFYKSGKFLLIRSFIPTNSNIKYKTNCVVYDEDENILTLQDIDANREIIPLIKLDGIRFSSKSFQIELNIKQIMILKEQEEIVINKFLIKRGDNDNNIKQSTSLTSKVEPTDVENKITKSTANIVQSTTINMKQTTPERSSELFEYTIDLDESDNDETVDENATEDNEDESEGDNASEYDMSDNDEETLESLEDVDEIKPSSKPVEIETKTKSLEMTDTKQLNQNDTLINRDSNNYLINDLDEYTIDVDVELDNKVEQEDGLDVVDISYETTNESIKLRNPNEVYYEIYRAAREKAKRAKKMAVEAYLEAKNIKTKYMLDDLDESDDDEENS